MNYSVKSIRRNTRRYEDRKGLPVILSMLILSLAMESSSLTSFRISNYNVTIFEVLLIVCLILSVIDLRKKMLLRYKRQERAVLVLMMLAVFTSILGMFWTSGMNFYYDMRIVLNLLEHLVLVALLMYYIRSFKQVRTALLLLLMGGGAAAAATISEAQGWADLGFSTTFRQGGVPYELGGLLIGTRGLDNAVMIYGDLFLVALPISLFMRTRGWLMLLRLSLFGCLCLAIIVIFSRSVWLGAAGELLLALTVKTGYVGRRRHFVLATLTMAAVVIYAVAHWGPLFFEWLVNLRVHSFEQRVNVYTYGLNAISQNTTSVLFGIGKGSIYAATSSVVHNIFLDILFSKGMIVFLLIIVIFVLILTGLLKGYYFSLEKKNWEAREFVSILLVMFCGLLIHGMGAPTTNSKPLWASIGIMLAFESIFRERRLLSGRTSLEP